MPIDLLPNYGPGTGKQCKNAVTMGNTLISNCEKKTLAIIITQILLKLKFSCLPFLWSLICLQLTISFGRFAHKSAWE